MKQYRKNKNFEKQFMEVMNDDSVHALIDITDKFNNEWKVIDPLQYFTIAFKILKSLSYKQVLDERIIKQYVKIEVKNREKKNQSVHLFFDKSNEEHKIEDIIKIPKSEKKMYDNISNIREIYKNFRKAQASYNNRGYRLPKNFETHFNTKLSDKNREILSLTTKYFLTKWRNINQFEYFLCGFELYKGFSYHQFFDQKVMTLYITKDKNKKRKLKMVSADLQKSKNFVLNYIKENNIKSLKAYGQMKEGEVSLPVQHFTHNFIDKFFLVKLINKGIVVLTDSDRIQVPYIIDQYREIQEEMNGENNDV
jgi:hypothetical protein